MRVNLDSSFPTDPRFKLLAAEAGVSFHEARSRVINVWFTCYQNRSPVLSTRLVDLCAELEGFATAMLNSDLARPHSESEIRISGVEERIAFLLKQGERGAQGGKTAARNRRVANAIAVREQALQRSARKRSSTRTATATANTLPPDPSPDPDPDLKTPLAPLRGGRASFKMGEGEWAKAKHVLEALGRYSRVAYRGTEAHVRLINARLQEGMTVLDLRKVAWYCARVLEWESKPDMRHYLRPETLYGPKTLARYLDAALAAYREKFGTDDEVSNG